MSDGFSLLDRLNQHARGLVAMVRPHHLAAAAFLAVVLLAVAGVRALAVPRSVPVPSGERLQIEMVTPDEPAVTAGAVMEVGDLVNGFEGLPAPFPAPVVEAAAYAPWDEEADAPSSRSSVKRYRDDADVPAPPPPEPLARGPPDGRLARWLGFDSPDRDYRAEREERRARIEAREAQERHRREVRRDRFDGEPRDDGRENHPG